MPNGQRIRDGAQLAHVLGLEVHAGHGLDYASAETIAALPEIVELNIGHFLVGEAVFDRASRETVRCDARRHATRGPRIRLRRSGMIIGLGSDLVDVRRIARVHRAPRRPLPRPHLHADGAGQGRAARQPVETYAKRFAAKEACAKALGTGFRRGVFWRDMGVVNLPSGRPTMQLTGGALPGSRRSRRPAARRASTSRSPMRVRRRRPS